MIDQSQIEVMFKTYGQPVPVKALLAKFKEEGVELNSIPDQGVNAVKELLAYTAGQQVVNAIAAMALGIVEIPASFNEPETPAPTALTTDEDKTPVVLDSEGVELYEGDTVQVIAGDANTRIGDIDSFETRGADVYALLTFEPEEGHTTRDSFAVRRDWLKKATVDA